MSSPFSLSKTRMVAWTVWLVASLFYAYQYILRVMPSIMLTDIMEQFGISAATFGQFSGVYYIGYSLMHLPIGILLDRYGPRKVMSVSILFTVAGLLPLIFSDYWVYPILGRVLTGMGSSAAILGIFKIVRMSFPEKRFARMLSISVTIGLIGAIYGGGPVSYFCEKWGSDLVVKGLALLGIALAALTYWIVPNMKREVSQPIFADMKEVFYNKKVILACLFAGFMVGPLEGFADVWGAAFLHGVYGFNLEVAASLPSMIFLGMCFGGPILSLIAERVHSSLLVIMGAGLAMALCFFALLFGTLSTAAITFSFLLVGVCCAYQILAIYKASTYVREGVAGLTTAVANMIIMIFGYAFHTVIGKVVSLFGGAASPEALFYGMMAIPVALSIGVVGYTFLFIKEKREFV